MDYHDTSLRTSSVFSEACDIPFDVFSRANIERAMGASIERAMADSDTVDRKFFYRTFVFFLGLTILIVGTFTSCITVADHGDLHPLSKTFLLVGSWMIIVALCAPVPLSANQLQNSFSCSVEYVRMYLVDSISYIM